MFISHSHRVQNLGINGLVLLTNHIHLLTNTLQCSFRTQSRKICSNKNHAFHAQSFPSSPEIQSTTSVNLLKHQKQPEETQQTRTAQTCFADYADLSVIQTDDVSNWKGILFASCVKLHSKLPLRQRKLRGSIERYVHLQLASCSLYEREPIPRDRATSSGTPINL